MKSELKEIYRNRFSEENENEKNKVWIELCRYFARFLKPDMKVIVDVAAGYCDFINNIPFCGDKYAFDLNPDVKSFAHDDVTSIVDEISCLEKHFQKESVSLFFESNFLEHISKDEIQNLFACQYRLLAPKGQIWILTPNIRYVGGKYWDFFDHITPITDKALTEVAEINGFRLKKVIARFMPFTTKSSLPKGRIFVRLYLMLLPISGWLLGEQSFLIFEKQ